MSRSLEILEQVVKNTRYKLDWYFKLETPEGNLNPELIVYYTGPDSRPLTSGWSLDGKSSIVTIANHFPIPEATYNYKTWRRWIFECCLKVEQHEASEWFIDTSNDERPFAPLHGPGEDPYTIHEFRDVVDAMTRQDGSINK